MSRFEFVEEYVPPPPVTVEIPRAEPPAIAVETTMVDILDTYIPYVRLVMVATSLVACIVLVYTLYAQYVVDAVVPKISLCVDRRSINKALKSRPKKVS